MTEKTLLMGYVATVEAIIFASDKPVRERELRHYIPHEQDMVEIIEVIQQRFDASCGIELRQVGDGWAFRTEAEVAERLNSTSRLNARCRVLHLRCWRSSPITSRSRAEIEEIRRYHPVKGNDGYFA